MERLKMVGEFLAVLALGLVIGRCSHFKAVNPPVETKVDTLLVHDTITSREAVFVERRVIDSVLVPVVDSVLVHDTLFVLLEREAVTWRDSLCEVYASGIRAEVDSVRHFVTTTIITKEVPVEIIKRTRWGVGIQVGAGASKEGLSPFVGVGISYNILTW